MSTPVIERPGTPGGRPRPQTRRVPAQRPSVPRPPAQRIPAQRIPAQRGPAEPRRAAETRRSRSARDTTGRAKFVLVVMVLLATGLVATLWLSTAAAIDSYALQEARQRTGLLTEQSEALRKEVAVLESPASLAQRASAQGLVPVDDPARLVVAPDGRVDVVGEPEAASGQVAPPAPGAPLPPGPAAAAQGAARQAAPPATEGAEREVPADVHAAGGRG